MKSSLAAVAFGCAFLVGAGTAHAAIASELLGQPLKSTQGEPLGTLEDLIVDVRDGRVLYLVVKGEQRFRTLPVRALGEDLRLDMRLAGETAKLEPSADPRFRRAGKLIGQPLVHPHPGGSQRLGTISDIEFDPATGRVEHVHVTSGDEVTHYPPGVLRHGRFPPLTQWRRQYLGPGDVGTMGYVRREPSGERRRLHNHEW
jgi:sporulation protein YlmC with PRC-barrel domain